jgi:hypothetical protein
MHDYATERGWFVIAESDWPDDTFDYLDPPGQGTCRRSDGAVGKLTDLVPDGWVLLDPAVTLNGDGYQDRVHVVFDPARLQTRNPGHMTNPWIHADGRWQVFHG